MAKLYVSNKDESARMFQSDLLEKFTRVHPAVPMVLYVPLAAYLLYFAHQSGMKVGAALGLIALGFFFWSFTEYVLHRLVFHFRPKTERGHRIWFMIHGVHHDYPNDSRRLVMPPSVSIPLCVMFYGLFRLLLGAEYVAPFFAGYLFGYLGYDMTHFAVHHFAMEGRIGRFLKQHHFKHHYLDPDRNFGVSLPLWDFVFGTYLRSRRSDAVTTKTQSHEGVPCINTESTETTE